METTEDMEFTFSRSKVSEFRAAFEKIREEEDINTSLIIRYVFKDDQATAIIPAAAARHLTEKQIVLLKSI